MPNVNIYARGHTNYNNPIPEGHIGQPNETIASKELSLETPIGAVSGGILIVENGEIALDMTMVAQGLKPEIERVKQEIILENRERVGADYGTF